MNSTRTVPLQRSIVAKDILTQLRYEIITGKRKDGEYLGEVALSNEMNVSRGPVRSAIQQLVAEGLAVSVENGRTCVTGVTEKDIEDIYELRMLLERKTISILKEKDLADFMPLIQVFNEMKMEYDRNEDCDSRKMAEYGYEIHVAMIRCSGNRAIWNAWNSIGAILHLIMEQNSNYVDSEKAFASHKELVEAIVQKQPNAEKVLEQHLLQDSKEIYLNFMHFDLEKQTK